MQKPKPVRQVEDKKPAAQEALAKPASRRKELTSVNVVAPKRRFPTIGKLFITFGLAAMITGGFGLVSDVINGPRRQHELQCAIAEHVVLDESPNPALRDQDRARLVAHAERKAEQCMED
jgi:hypothetical protein